MKLPQPRHPRRHRRSLTSLEGITHVVHGTPTGSPHRLEQVTHPTIRVIWVWPFSKVESKEWWDESIVCSVGLPPHHHTTTPHRKPRGIYGPSPAHGTWLIRPLDYRQGEGLRTNHNPSLEISFALGGFSCAKADSAMPLERIQFSEPPTTGVPRTWADDFFRAYHRPNALYSSD